MAFGSLIKPNGNQLPDVALLFYLDKAQNHYKLFWPSDFFISLVSRPTNATWYWLQGESFCISEHSLLWNVHSYKLPLKMLAIKPRRFFQYPTGLYHQMFSFVPACIYTMRDTVHVQ